MRGREAAPCSRVKCLYDRRNFAPRCIAIMTEHYRVPKVNKSSECGERHMSLVVVSNRVTKAKLDEPISGGLASALLPVVQRSGAIWVGSSGRLRDASHKDYFAEIEALGAGAIVTVDLSAAHYR